MLKEALEKCSAGEGDSAHVLGPIVPIAERDLAVLDPFQTAVGEGDAEEVGRMRSAKRAKYAAPWRRTIAATSSMTPSAIAQRSCISWFSGSVRVARTSAVRCV